MSPIDFLAKGPQTQIGGKWVLARPLPGDFIERLRDAWAVLTGKADAVTWEGQ